MSDYYCDGFGHLEGETVSILADGVVQAEQEVVDGQIDATDFADAVEVHVGLKYTSELQPMKPVVSTYMGTSAASIVGVHRMGVSLHNSDGVQYGTDTGTLYDININEVGLENTSEKEGLFSGVIDVSVEGGFDLDNNIRIVTDAPLPCVVRALIPEMEQTGI
jgi:hypothetical protein